MEKKDKYSLKSIKYYIIIVENLNTLPHFIIEAKEMDEVLEILEKEFEGILMLSSFKILIGKEINKNSFVLNH